MQPPRKYLQYISLALLPLVLLFALWDQWPFISGTFSRGQIIGRDAYNLWTAGKILLDGGGAAQIYNNTAFSAYQTAALGPGIGWNSYLYPPPGLLIAVAIATLPYSIALPVYTLLGPLAFTTATTFRTRLWRKGWFLSLLAPMVMCNMVMGQNGLITAAMLIGGLRLLSRKSAWAGILFGMLAFKPFLGVLLPILLLVRRDWNALMASTVSLVVVSTLPVAFWGIGTWHEFFRYAMPVQKMILEDATGIGMLMITSAFNSGRILGLGAEINYVLQGLVAGFATLIFLRYVWRSQMSSVGRRMKPMEPRDILVFTLCTSLISPYIHNYDLAMVEGAILLLCIDESERKASQSSILLVGICWCTAFFSPFLNLITIPVAPLALLWALLKASSSPPVSVEYQSVN